MGDRIRGIGFAYTEAEDNIIRRELMGHRDVLRRCIHLSRTSLPDRDPQAIRQRWYTLIGTHARIRNYKNPVQDVADLLSPEQRRRLSVRMPSMRRVLADTLRNKQ